jgi:putative transposase
MKRVKIQIRLTDEEETTLRLWAAAGRTEQRMAQRARVILLSAEGYTLEEVRAGSGLSPQNCSKWRKRFMRDRLDGLKDIPRPGRPRQIGPEERVRVMALACQKPSDGSTRWTIRRLAKVVGVGKSTVHRILNEGEIKPHKVSYWCGKSPDPEFEEKQAAILGLYLNPPENALVLSVDEKSQIQALDRTQPELPLRPGKPRRLTHTYKRHGTTSLLAALVVHEGEITGRCVDSHDHRCFLGFLKHLYRRYPHRHLHVIADNLSAHKHTEVMEWVKRRRRLTLHFTPTYASWLNQIEIWFSIFTRDLIKGAVWHSKHELIDRILYYIQKYNQERAHPFQWTYDGTLLAA